MKGEIKWLGIIKERRKLVVNTAGTTLVELNLELSLTGNIRLRCSISNFQSILKTHVLFTMRCESGGRNFLLIEKGRFHFSMC